MRESAQKVNGPLYVALIQGRAVLGLLTVHLHLDTKSYFQPFQIPMDVFDELETQLDMARPLTRPRRNFPSFDYFDSFGNFNGFSGPKMASYV